MAAQRVKGQETVLSVYEDGDLVSRLDSIQNSELVFELEILEEGYLGERSDRYDSIFKGMSVKATGHLTNGELFQLADRIVARAKRLAGAIIRVDIATTLVFPGGDLVNIACMDMQFGPIPIRAGSRQEFVQWDFEAKGSEYRYL